MISTVFCIKSVITKRANLQGDFFYTWSLMSGEIVYTKNMYFLTGDLQCIYNERYTPLIHYGLLPN